MFEPSRSEYRHGVLVAWTCDVCSERYPAGLRASFTEEGVTRCLRCYTKEHPGEAAGFKDLTLEDLLVIHAWEKQRLEELVTGLSARVLELEARPPSSPVPEQPIADLPKGRERSERNEREYPDGGAELRHVVRTLDHYNETFLQERGVDDEIGSETLSRS